MGRRHHRATADMARRTEPTISAPPVLNTTGKTGTLETISEQQVRLRAYRKWESAGRPNCDGLEFWLAAEKELEEARVATTLEP